MSKAECREQKYDRLSYRQYQGDGYQVRYEVRESWASGFNASVTLENTSDRVIEDWRLKSSKKRCS